ncbi:hypothetical protein DSM112329_03659 [Paraconexibacter sp. AEG42_29]|uniref:Uncharacterized protein n=1 Tax=Paraconexibacter sp. AEG42_29 TaxID=2997339 RepID=A0AAU7AZ76_9ACTN
MRQSTHSRRPPRPRFVPSVLVVLAVAAGALTGCGGDDDGDVPGVAGRTAAAASGPRSLAITARATGAKSAEYAMPATVEAGLTTITLRNETKGPREASLVRVEGDHTLTEVLEVINDQGGAPIPDWIHADGGVAIVAPGQAGTATQNLVPGDYYVTDSTDPDSGVTPAKPYRFTVTGPVSEGALPAAPATVIAKDYGFTFAGLKAGKNTIRFENTGKELHHALFFGEAPGATRAEVLKFFSARGEVPGKPPLDFARMSGTTVLDGGLAQNTELDLKPGRYAVVCFVSDRAGGPPHLAKGMFAEITVK